MKVLEVTEDIHSEGAFIGTPVNVIKLAGCNLSCSFCYEKDVLNITEGIDWTTMELANEMKSPLRKSNIVVITGGEPCVHEDLPELIDRLALQKKFIIIETNGTLEVPQGVDWVSVSPKAEADYKIDSLCKPNELKYIVTEDFDVDTAIPETIRKLYAGNIYLIPEGSDPQLMHEVLLAKIQKIVYRDPRLRLGIQLHRFMEV